MPEVRDFMDSSPATVHPDTPVDEAGLVLPDDHGDLHISPLGGFESGHNPLPVVDEDGRLVGVGTRLDVLGALAA